MAAVCDATRCVYCAGCVSVCPFLALTLNETRIVVDDKKCTECEICVKACPASAMSIPGKGGPDELRKKK